MLIDPVSTERHVGWDRHGTSFRRSNLFQTEKKSRASNVIPRNNNNSNNSKQPPSCRWLHCGCYGYVQVYYSDAWASPHGKKLSYSVAELTLHRLHRPGGRVCCSRSGHHDRLLERSITIGRAPSRKTAQKRKRKRRRKKSKSKESSNTKKCSTIRLLQSSNQNFLSFPTIRRKEDKKKMKTFLHLYYDVNSFLWP
jgi:hypothetical protein